MPHRYRIDANGSLCCSSGLWLVIHNTIQATISNRTQSNWCDVAPSLSGMSSGGAQLSRSIKRGNGNESQLKKPTNHLLQLRKLRTIFVHLRKYLESDNSCYVLVKYLYAFDRWAWSNRRPRSIRCRWVFCSSCLEKLLRPTDAIFGTWVDIALKVTNWKLKCSPNQSSRTSGSRKADRGLVSFVIYVFKFSPIISNSKID